MIWLLLLIPILYGVAVGSIIVIGLIEARREQASDRERFYESLLP